MGNPLNRLYEAVAWVIKQLYGGLSHLFGTNSGWTWALSIVILVVLMRLIMVPLFIKTGDVIRVDLQAMKYMDRVKTDR